MSASQFEDSAFPYELKEILKCFNLDPKYLEIEITENIEIKELHRVRKIFSDIKQLGIGIAIDDFGTAYSSLNYIKQLPLDKIKIDKGFIDGIGRNSKEETILKTVIKLINDLGLIAVAEGVNTKRH